MLINNTTRSEVQNGYFGNVHAYVLTGINDEIIVMPYQDSNAPNAFWTSTPYTNDINRAYVFRFNRYDSWVSFDSKSSAFEIRPIMVK